MRKICRRGQEITNYSKFSKCLQKTERRTTVLGPLSTLYRTCFDVLLSKFLLAIAFYTKNIPPTPKFILQPVKSRTVYVSTASRWAVLDSLAAEVPFTRRSLRILDLASDAAGHSPYQIYQRCDSDFDALKNRAGRDSLVLYILARTSGVRAGLLLGYHEFDITVPSPRILLQRRFCASRVELYLSGLFFRIVWRFNLPRVFREPVIVILTVVNLCIVSLVITVPPHS